MTDVGTCVSRQGVSRRGVLRAGVGLAGLAAARPGWAGQEMLRFGLSTFPPNWRPYTHTGSAGGAVKLLLHRRLMSYDPQGTLRGELAEGWEQEADGSYLFRLRDGIRFQNGDPVDAAAVQYSMAQIADPKTSALLHVPLATIERVEAVDRLTVRFRLHQASATLPFYLASYNCPIVSPKSTDAEAVGCGPYRVADQERGTRIDFAAARTYYETGLPRTGKVRFVNYPDESLRVAALAAGDVDMIEYVPWQSMAAIEADQRLVLDGVPDGPPMFLSFNCVRGPFKDSRLRRAVALAVNRPDIVQAAFFGRATVLEGLPMPITSPFTDQAALTVFRRDIGRAKQLMAEAGVAEGFSTTILSTATYNMHKATAEVVQQNLAEIGIQAALQFPDYPTRIALGNRGQYEMGVMAYGAEFNDPDALTSMLGSNPQGTYVRSWGYENAKLDGILNRARGERDAAVRAALYREATPILAEDAPVVGLCWRSQAYALSRAVTGYRNMPGALTFLSLESLADVVVG